MLKMSLVAGLLCNTVKSSLLSRSSLLTLTTPIIISKRDRIFWERDKRSGKRAPLTESKTKLQHIREGFKELKVQIGVWKNEVKEHLLCDPILTHPPGETDLIFNFDNPKELEKFVFSSDSDYGEGFSKCTFQMSKSGRALFSGTIDTRVPKTGDIKRAGYCAIRSARKTKSFYRDDYYDWRLYNTLVLKVRGDGRSYMINLSCQGYYDVQWYDIYQYVLYTRGGPYWQTAKIPFSKFLLSSKGRVQDKQCRIPLDQISHVGIAIGDKINAKFGLEIEYIGLEYDPLHEEEFAYEMYKTDKYIVGM